jgi:hypothetical protein
LSVLNSWNTMAAILVVVSVGLKLPLAWYGLPNTFCHDEIVIFKEPFKMAALYASGDFRSPTNLGYWAVSLWFGIVFLVGRIVGAWPDFAQFRTLVVAESPTLLFWGRIFIIASAATGLWILARVLARTVADPALRALTLATIALNPIDLVSNAWIKLDGLAFLLAAMIIAAIVSYAAEGSLAARRRVYLVATVACTLRPDFFVMLAAFAGYDMFVAGKPVRPLIGTAIICVASFLVITLRPLAILQPLWESGPDAAIVVVEPFEEAKIRQITRMFAQADVGGALLANLTFYGVQLLWFGPAVAAIMWPGLERHSGAILLAVIAGLMLVPVMVIDLQASRYLLLPLVCLILGAAWRLGTAAPRRLALCAMSGTLVIAGSVTLSAALELQIAPDPRVRAGAYLLSHTTPRELVALEEAKLIGGNPVLDECPEALREKAAALKAARLSTGETMLAQARRSGVDCRVVIELRDDDPYAGTPVSGRFVNRFDLGALHPLPRYIASRNDYTASSPARPIFARELLARYELVATFDREPWDPRVRPLLSGAFYSVPIFIYKLRA